MSPAHHTLSLLQTQFILPSRKKQSKMSRIQTSISSGWEWRLANANQNSHALEHPEFQKWTPAVQFPSVIHIELLHTKQIPNPNIGENERQFQWVGECDWEYRCSFPTPSTANSPTYADLVFEGLDTYAIVKLNGFTILESNNMFLPARIDVKKHLKAEGENELVILFESPLRKGTQLEDEFGPRTSMMRDKRRMHMRKAQVSFTLHDQRNSNVKFSIIGVGIGDLLL